MLSRAVAERLIREKQYGLAVAFSVRAGDSRKLDGIADQVLDTYVRQGQFSPSSSLRIRSLTDALLSLGLARQVRRRSSLTSSRFLPRCSTRPPPRARPRTCRPPSLSSRSTTSSWPRTSRASKTLRRVS